MSYLYILPFDTVFTGKNHQSLINSKFDLTDSVLEKEHWELIFLQMQKLNYRIAVIVPTEENPTYVLPYKNIIKQYFDNIFGKQQQYISIDNIFCYAGKPTFHLIAAIINDYNQTYFKPQPIKSIDFRDRVKLLHYEDVLLEKSIENNCQVLKLHNESANSQVIDFLKKDLQLLKLKYDHNKIKTINTIASRYKKYLTKLKDETQSLYRSFVQFNFLEIHYIFLINWLKIYSQTLNNYIKKQSNHNTVLTLTQAYSERYKEALASYNKAMTQPNLRQFIHTNNHVMIDFFNEELKSSFETFVALLAEQIKIYASLNIDTIQTKTELENFYQKSLETYQQKISQIKTDRAYIIEDMIHKLTLYEVMNDQAVTTKALLESTINEVPIKEKKGVASLCQLNDYENAKNYLNEMDRDIAGINKLDAHGRALLHVACYYGHYEWVKGLVIDYHAKISVRSRLDALPIHIAAENNHNAIIKLLLEHGADVNAKGYKTQRTALHYAVNQNNQDLIKLLFQHGADITRYTADSEGRTALHYAVEKRNISVIQLILAYRHHPSVLITLRVKNHLGFTSLGEAILAGDNQVIIDILLAEKVALDREEVKLLTRIAHLQKRNDIHAALKLCENTKISWFKSAQFNSDKQKVPRSTSYFLISPKISDPTQHADTNNNTAPSFSNSLELESNSLPILHYNKP